MTFRLLVPLCLGVLLAPLPALGQEMPFSGTIEKDTTWSGKVVLTGDVLVPRGVTLRISPGTRVTLRADAEPTGDPAYDLNPALTEIHVEGRLLAQGTARDPVVLGRAPERSENKKGGRRRIVPSWLGIVLSSERDRGTRLAHCVFRGALAAVQCGSGTPVIEDSTFLECSIGVSAGTVYGDRRGRRRIFARYPGPRIERCRFGDCDTGVYVDRRGRPMVTRSVFFGCAVGIGRWHAGVTYPTYGLGPLVERCDFLGNQEAVHGSSSVRNSIFYGNRLAFSASSFHRKYATVIDRYHRSHNTYFENAALTNGDIPLGESAVFEDPGYRGPLPEDTAALLQDGLAKALGLAPDSPIRGAASDGGDPGAWGSVGTERGGMSIGRPPKGFAFESWLVPGPPGAFTEKHLAAVKKALRRPAGAPVAGDRLGGAVWSLFPAPERTLDASSALLPGGIDVVLLASAHADASGQGRLYLGLDGRVSELLWNGQPLASWANRRRLDYRDQSWKVPVRKGRNVLFLRVRPATPGRVSAHLVPRSAGLSLLPAPVDDDPFDQPAVDRVSISAGGVKSGGTIVVRLRTRLHWLAALRPTSWRLFHPSGAEIEIPAGAVEYDAARSKVRIRGPRFSRGRIYRLVVSGLTDCLGRPLDPGRPEWELTPK